MLVDEFVVGAEQIGRDQRDILAHFEQELAIFELRCEFGVAMVYSTEIFALKYGLYCLLTI